MRKKRVVQGLLLASMCLLFLSGCNVSNRKSEGAKHLDSSKEKLLQHDSALSAAQNLRSWWSFLGDKELDELIKSAVNLRGGAKRSHEGDTTFIREMIIGYLDYRFLQMQLSALEGLQEDAKQNAVDASGFLMALEDLKNQSDKNINLIANKSGLLAEYVSQVLKAPKPMPQADIKPVLGTSVRVLATAPKVMALTHQYNQDTKRLYDVFPDMMIGDFFGVNALAYTNDQAPWELNAGSFAKNINLSALPMSQDAQQYQVAIMERIFGFRALLIQYSELLKQTEVLEKGYEKEKINYTVLEDQAAFDLDLSPALMRKAIALNDMKVAVEKARYESLKTLVSIYDYFGVY